MTAIRQDSRPALRVLPNPTSVMPLEVERDFDSEDTQLVALHLCESAREQLVRAVVRSHMADLVNLSHLLIQERETLRSGLSTARSDAREINASAQIVINRLVGALGSRGSTTWQMTPQVAQELMQEIDSAAAPAQTCSIGTCTSPAQIGDLCAAHDERG